MRNKKLVNFEHQETKMKKSLLLFPLLLISLLFFSCKKEQSLTPNKEAAKTQQAGIDFLNNGGETDLGGNGGSSSSTVDEFMNATADGSSKSYSSFSYTDNGSSLTITGSNSSGGITIAILSIPAAGDTLFFDEPLSISGNYVPGAGMAYTALDGNLIVDSTTTTMFKGRFFFNAKNNNGADIVAITAGSFRIAK